MRKRLFASVAMLAWSPIVFAQSQDPVVKSITACASGSTTTCLAPTLIIQQGNVVGELGTAATVGGTPLGTIAAQTVGGLKASGGDASAVNVTAAQNTGATTVARTLASIVGDQIDVINFGADPTGNSSLGAQTLNAFTNAIESVASGSDVRVKVPFGVYYLTGAVGAHSRQVTMDVDPGATFTGPGGAAPFSTGIRSQQASAFSHLTKVTLNDTNPNAYVVDNQVIQETGYQGPTPWYRGYTYSGNGPGAQYSAWAPSTVYAASAYVTAPNGLSYTTASGGTSGATAPTCGSGSCSDGGVTWTFVATYLQSVSDALLARWDHPTQASGVGLAGNWTIALFPIGGGTYSAWAPSTGYAAKAIVTAANGHSYQTNAGGTSGASTPTCTSGSCSDGGVTWTFLTTYSYPGGSSGDIFEYNPVNRYKDGGWTDSFGNGFGLMHAVPEVDTITGGTLWGFHTDHAFATVQSSHTNVLGYNPQTYNAFIAYPNSIAPNGRAFYAGGDTTGVLTAITWSSGGGGTVTGTTRTPHGMASGATVQIVGVQPAGYNGSYTVASVPTNTTFTYSLASNPGTQTTLGLAEQSPTKFPFSPLQATNNWQHGVYLNGATFQDGIGVLLGSSGVNAASVGWTDGTGTATISPVAGTTGNVGLALTPAGTGTVTAPTPSTNDNSTKVATTAFVIGQAGSATPLVNGTAASGASLLYARQDHVHPTDTTRAPLASPNFTTQAQITTGGNTATLTAGTGGSLLVGGSQVGTGSVSSVAVSGGTTGLTTSGGPVTGSGTITLGGTLGAANGGTGLTSLGTGVASALGSAVTGSGSIVLSASPTLTTPNLDTPSTLVLTNATGLPLSTGVTGTLPAANLPVATSSALGGVKPDGTTIANASGAISVTYGTSANTAAQGNDSRITGALSAVTAASTYAPLASPTLTGTPVAPTATVGTSTTQIATTAFVQGAAPLGAGFVTTTTGSIPVPTNWHVINFWAIGGGGGSGCGYVVTSGTSVSGGASGGAASRVDGQLLFSSTGGSSLSITIGAAGTPCTASGTTNGSTGSAATAGGSTYIAIGTASRLAPGGGAGANGQLNAVSGGGGSAGIVTGGGNSAGTTGGAAGASGGSVGGAGVVGTGVAILFAGASGSGSPNGAAGVNAPLAVYGPGSGASGAGLAATPVALAGGTGGQFRPINTSGNTAGGLATCTAGSQNAGNSAISGGTSGGTDLTGIGGAGGASCTAANGGNGGNSAGYGASGGAGGSALAGFLAGSGGASSPGAVYYEVF